MMAKTYTAWLDKRRRLRLTRYAMNRLKSVYGGDTYEDAIENLKAMGSLDRMSGYYWLLAVTDDPDLTPALMKDVLIEIYRLPIVGRWRFRQLMNKTQFLNRVMNTIREEEA